MALCDLQLCEQPLHCCFGHICCGIYVLRILHRRALITCVLLQAYKDLTEVMANQQDLVDIEHRLLPMLNVKVRPGPGKRCC